MTTLSKLSFWILVLSFFSDAAMAQAVEKPQQENQKQEKSNRNILGTPITKAEWDRLKNNPAPTKAPPGLVTIPQRPSVGTPVQVVQKALTARTNAWISKEVQDSTSEGTITFFDAKGPEATFGVTLIRKGEHQFQRVIHQNGKEMRQGSDGTQTWNSTDGMSSAADGHVLHFMESFTDRSFRTLFNASSKATPGVEIQDLGMKGDARVLEVQEKQEKKKPSDPDLRKTRYYINADTSMISRIELVTAEVFSTFLNRKTESIEAIVFSDYRDVGGAMAPFKIESFTNGIKVEEMLFKAVTHNTSVQDRVFRP